MYTTRADVEQSIIDVIEAAGSPVQDAAFEYDIAAIADDCFEYSPTRQKFEQHLSVNEFWAVVERHAH